MLKKPINLLILSLFVALIILSWRSCSVYDRLSQLQGLYEGYKKAAEAEKARLEKEIQERDAKIQQAEIAITQAKERIIEYERQINLKDRTIAKLEEEYQNLTTPEEKIENLNTQVQIWKEKFNLCRQEISEKDKIIFSLTEKYNAQLDIANSYKMMYFREVEVRQMLERNHSSLEKELMALKKRSQLKTYMLIGLGGIMAYMLLNGGC